MMRIGIRCFNLLCRIGFPRKNLESLSTGAYTALPLTIISGIREICIFRTRKSGNITERHLESTQNLATKISYRCFTRKSSIQNNGRNYSKRQEQNMFFRWQSTMMDSRCTKARFLNTMPLIWGQSATF